MRQAVRALVLTCSGASVVYRRPASRAALPIAVVTSFLPLLGAFLLPSSSPRVLRRPFALLSAFPT
jgi:hypothetical protein